MNLFYLLEHQVSQHPDKTALIDGKCGREREINYSDFLKHVHSKSHDLHLSGITEGSNVLVMIPMRMELYITLLALWHLGATALFLNPLAGRKHIRACCNMILPQAIVGMPGARWLSLLHGALLRVPVKHYWRFKNAQVGHEHEKPAALVPKEQPAILSFTSGSTGTPKAAIRTHGLLQAQYSALRPVLDAREDDLDLATMPIFVLMNLATGISTLIPDANLSKPGFIRPNPVLKQIQHYQPTRTIASPSFLRRLHDSANEKELELLSFEKVITGGAPVFPETLNRISETFCKARMSIAYGSTEAEPISHVSWNEYSQTDRQKTCKGGGLLVGRICEHTELLVIEEQWGQPVHVESDQHLKSLCVPAGSVGEIIVTGEHVIGGYVKGQGDRENKIHTGSKIWHRTGDAGYLDPHGRLWLMGRCSAKFHHTGQVIYPFAVEAAAVESFQCSIAACVEIDGQPTLVLPESYRGKLPASFQVNDLVIKRVVKSSIPLDSRHNAKVNYAKLRRLLK